MKALLTSIAAVLVLSSAPGVRADENEFLNENPGVQADEQFSQELSKPGLSAGENQFGKMEKDASGILMHGGAVYIVQRLGEQLTLPDGTTVQPDGSILSPDGTQKSLNTGEMLGTDGGVKPAPFIGAQTSSGKLPVAPRSTDSNTNSNSPQTTPPLTNSPGTQDTKTNDQKAFDPEAEFQD